MNPRTLTVWRVKLILAKLAMADKWEEFGGLDICRRYVGLKKLTVLASWLRDCYRSPNRLYTGLDAGCGKGDITLVLACLGYQMMGIDISPQAIHQAEIQKTRFFVKARYLPTFLVGNIEDLSVGMPRNVFDFCVCSEVLEHVEHPASALASVFKVLRADGLLIVTVPNGYGPYSLVYDHFRNKLLAKIVPAIRRSEHVQTFAWGKIRKSIERAGFKIQQVKHSDFISFLPFLAESNKICRWDCRWADILPAPLVSGWYFLCQKKGQDSK